jgi:multidrug resistance efflux pump
MKRDILLFLFTAFVVGCSSKEEKKTAASAFVNPAKAIQKEIIGIGKVEPENEIINLAATAGGIVTIVYKTDGQSVKAGDALVQLDNQIELLKVAEVNSKIQTQKSEIAIEKANYKEVLVKITNKRKQLLSTKKLVDKGAETAQVLDDAETEVKTLETLLEKEQASISLAENKLGELLNQLKMAETELSKKRLISPFPGNILDMEITKGAAINMYAKYATLAPVGNTIIKAEVDELFSNKLAVGQQVSIRFIGTEKPITTGEIIILSPYLKKKSLFSEKADDQEDRRVREIKISLKDDAGLIINSKVECIIKL